MSQPLKEKIVLVLKEGEADTRGNRDAKVIIETCVENWDRIQEQYD